MLFLMLAAAQADLAHALDMAERTHQVAWQNEAADISANIATLKILIEMPA